MVENCQVLGRIAGTNQENAIDNLLLENPWIKEAGFDNKKFFVKQILTNEQHADILALLNYLGKKDIYLNKDNCYEKTHELVNRLREI